MVHRMQNLIIPFKEEYEEAVRTRLLERETISFQNHTSAFRMQLKRVQTQLLQKKKILNDIKEVRNQLRQQAIGILSVHEAA